MYSLNSEQMNYLESLINFSYPIIPGVPLKQTQLNQIAALPETAYYFAKEVVKGKWEQGERAISKTPRTAFYYALVCLDGPFDLGRYTIEQSHQFKYRYSRLVKCWGKTT
jgi:hypothetical protein